MRFVVFGAGAIGSGIGGHLHRTGHDVLLVGRPAHVDRIRLHGLLLVTADETYTLSPPAVSSAEDVGFTDGDALLLCVKSQDTDRALVEIRAAGGDPQTLPVLCCQNSIINNSLGNAGFIEVGQFPAGLDMLSEDVARALSVASYAAYANSNVMAAKA